MEQLTPHESLSVGAPNTPWYQRESTWTGIAKIALDLSALAAGIAAFANPMDPDGRWLLAAAVLKTAGSVSGQVATWFVRLGVTKLAEKSVVKSE